MAEREPLLDSRHGDEEQQQATKKPSTLLTVCPFILGNEFCERLAYNGLATNLVTYLTHIMGIDSASAAVQVMVFEGTAYVTPLLGAYAADSFWGRYKTILMFSLIYCFGVVLLTLSSWVPGLQPDVGQDASAVQLAALFGALGVIALGTGGIKPNVSAFGADQFDETDPQDKAEKASFFNWFYLAINLGSLISCTVVVYIQDSISWTLGFAIPAVAMALALLLFLAGSSRYRHIPATESPMARVVKVVWAAIQNRWRSKRQATQVSVLNPDEGAEDSSYHRAMFFQHATHQGLIPKSQADSMLAAAAAGAARGGSPAGFPGGYGVDRSGNSVQQPTPTKSYMWLEDAITEWQTSQGHLVVVGEGGVGRYTPRQVEEVKMVLRLLPIFWTTVMYWTVYGMMGTMFIQQGSLMERNIPIPFTNYTVYIPSASMALFNTGAIVFLIPLYDGVFEPLMRRMGKKFTLLQRIGWGMVLAVVSMFYAAGVEWQRLRMYRELHPGDTQDTYPPQSVPMTILWQAPAYVLVAASEVYASIGQLEFFYDQAPDVMRSCSMALQLLSTAVGSYLGGALVAAVAAITASLGNPWLPRDLNHGHMDYFLVLIGLILVVNTVAFVWVAMYYEYKAVEHRVVFKVATVEEQQQQQAGGPHISPRPTAGPAMPSAMPMDATAARRSQYHYRGSQEQEQDIYSRSLAYFPPSPALPAPFR